MCEEAREIQDNAEVYKVDSDLETGEYRGMDSLSRFHLSQHEDGTWHVIDVRTGGPAEIEYGGKFILLWKLPRSEAEQLSSWLNKEVKADRLAR